MSLRRIFITVALLFSSLQLTAGTADDLTVLGDFHWYGAGNSSFAGSTGAGSTIAELEPGGGQSLQPSAVSFSMIFRTDGGSGFSTAELVLSGTFTTQGTAAGTCDTQCEFTTTFADARFDLLSTGDQSTTTSGAPPIQTTQNFFNGGAESNQVADYNGLVPLDLIGGTVTTDNPYGFDLVAASIPMLMDLTSGICGAIACDDVGTALVFASTDGAVYKIADVAPVPVPASVWLFTSALLGLASAKRKSKNN